jgi:hypothetical protein
MGEREGGGGMAAAGGGGGLDGKFSNMDSLGVTDLVEKIHVQVLR